jgi:hypothetical protein
MERMKMNNA